MYTSHIYALVPLPPVSVIESVKFILTSHGSSPGGRVVRVPQCQSDIQSCSFGCLHLRVVQVSKI